MSSRLSAKAGLAIRKLRLARGWTLAQLGEKASVPLSTLSKVELGQTSLSYENLLRICRGLEIDMERLIGAEADADGAGHSPGPGAVGRRAVARAGDGEPIDLPSGAGRIVGGELICKAFTPVVVEVTANDLETHGGFHRDEGEAYVMVLDGALAVHSEIYAPLKLRAGDGVYFDARAGYALLKDGATPCRALLVLAGDRQA
jgi:transcriptional regulator with XRE-family HTH domain